MKILSLFDGISCARVALDRAGIEVEAYYASEIEPRPIEMSKRNWPEIIQLGDVRNVKRNMPSAPYLRDIAHSLNDIDLLIGGSPCQDLSRAKTDGKGLEGERSSLFYEYLRILRETKPKWFILENVASMKQVYKDRISEELGVQPIMIDAALVSAQSRRRLFWTNIPGVTLPEDRGIMLKHILEDGELTEERAKSLKPIRLGVLKNTNGGQGSRIYSIEGKAVSLPSHPGGNKTGLYFTDGPFLGLLDDGRLVVREATKKGYAIAEEGDSVDISRGEVRPLTAVECERLQSLPDGYTDGFPKSHRISAIGNAFNVEVVRHIISHIPKQ